MLDWRYLQMVLNDDANTNKTVKSFNIKLLI